MKRILIFLLVMASMGFMAVGVEAYSDSAKSATNSLASASPQIDRILRQVTRRQRRYRKNRNKNNNVSYETRTVWKGRKEYRDTYRITWKNGIRHEKRVEHIRIR